MWSSLYIQIPIYKKYRQKINMLSTLRGCLTTVGLQYPDYKKFSGQMVFISHGERDREREKGTYRLKET